MSIATARRSVTVLTVLAAAVAGVVVSAAPATAASAPGTPYTWGSNGFGQLGSGTNANRFSAAAVSGLTGVVDLHGGREHVIALTSAGKVYTWGSNANGQLGVSGGNRSTPVQVPGLSGVTAVATGHYHSLAIDGSGQVWSWGLNASGQLGDGTKTNRSAPVKVSGLTDAVAIAAGRDMSYALRRNGQVMAWGLNSDGELGDGTTTDRTTPVRVSGLTDVVQIAGGRDHGLAVRADRTVWAWGWNEYGQLGDGSTIDRKTPVQIATGMTAVIAGAHHSYGLRSDGQVMAWGRNYRNELGDGTKTNRTRPVAVTGVTNAVAIGTGRDHGLAVRTDGRVQAWGYNANGQLGDGTTTNRATAILVPGVTGATMVSGGGEYSVALTTSGTTPPANTPPKAHISVDCVGLSCDISGQNSTDSDGTVVAFSWDFGDGVTSPAAEISHRYAVPGTYLIRLTVTDDDGATGTTTQSVTATEAPPPTGSVTFVGALSSAANATSHRVTVPSAVQSGDGLVLTVSLGNPSATVTVPSGWTLVGQANAKDLHTLVYRRAATAADAGKAVVVKASATVKGALTLSAYHGVAAGSFVTAAFTVSSASGTARVAPAVTVPAGAWVVSQWADRSSSDRTWSVPATVTARTAAYGTGGGRVTTVLADSAGPVAAGSYAARTATTSAAGGQAIGTTLVLTPA